MKTLNICCYYTGEDEKEWFVFIGYPTFSNAQKCFRAFWGETLKSKNIIGVYTITKEKDVNGKDYSIIIK